MLDNNTYYGPGRVVAFSTKSGKTVYWNGKAYRRNTNGKWDIIERDKR